MCDWGGGPERGAQAQNLVLTLTVPSGTSLLLSTGLRQKEREAGGFWEGGRLWGGLAILPASTGSQCPYRVMESGAFRIYEK